MGFATCGYTSNLNSLLSDRKLLADLARFSGVPDIAE